MNELRVKICKLGMRTIGRMLPGQRYPLGKLGNSIRCFFAKGIVAKIGESCRIEKGAEIQEGCIFYDDAGIGYNCLISRGTIIKSGNMMGPNCHIYTENHYYDDQLHKFDGYCGNKPVEIGYNVWMGYNVTIMPGVVIGDCVAIGAGSVVTKNIPAGVMAAGNPCVVKKIIDREVYERGML